MPWTKDSSVTGIDSRAVGIVPFGTNGSISAPFEGHTATTYDAVANTFSYIILPDYTPSPQGQTQGYPFLVPASTGGDSYIASAVGPLVYIAADGTTTPLGWPSVSSGVYCTGITTDGAGTVYVMFTNGALATYTSSAWTVLPPLPLGKDGYLTAISWNTSNTLLGGVSSIPALYQGAANSWSDFSGTDWFSALPASFTASTTDFSALITGYWLFPESGTYNIGILSDDGALLFLDGQYIGGVRLYSGGNMYTYSAYIESGYHHVDIYYQQGGGGAALQVYWGNIPNAAADTLVDSSVLRQSSPGVPVYNNGFVYVPINNTGLIYIYNTGPTPGWEAYYPDAGNIGKINATYSNGTNYYAVHTESTYEIANTGGLYSAVSPDGLWAAASDPVAGTVAIYDIALNTAVSFTLAGALAPAFTPDSLQLLVPTGSTVEVYTLSAGAWGATQSITASVTAVCPFYLPGSSTITAFFLTSDTLTRWTSISQVWSSATPALTVTGAVGMTYMANIDTLFAYTTTSIIPVPYNATFQTWTATSPITGFDYSLVDISHNDTGVVVIDNQGGPTPGGNLYYLTNLSGTWAITSQVAMPSISGVLFEPTGLTANDSGNTIFVYGAVYVGGVADYAISYAFDSAGNIQPPRQKIATWGSATASTGVAGKPAYALGRLALPSPAGMFILENRGNELYGFIAQPMLYPVTSTGFGTAIPLPTNHNLTALAIDSGGNLWFTDTAHNQVIKTNATGALLRTVTIPQPYATAPTDVVLGLSGIALVNTNFYVSASLSVADGAVFWEVI